MTSLRFTKMEGLGNDFVVIDATRSAFALQPDGDPPSRRPALRRRLRPGARRRAGA